VATLEFVPEEDRVSPAVPAAFALIMLAETPGGDAYTRAELEHMFDRAGFSRHEFHAMPPSPHSVLVSTGIDAREQSSDAMPRTTLWVSAETSGETGDPSNRVGISSVVWSILVLPA